MTIPAIVIHGGCGSIEYGEAHDAGLRRAVAAAWGVLASRGGAADAVEAAVVAMEDDTAFNAGLGSTLNVAGEVETDASIMLGDLSCGAVGALTKARNPIMVARLVMERTDHVLLAGAGADAFARAMGCGEADLRTEERVRQHAAHMEKLRAGGAIARMPKLGELAPELGYGTVGAAAVDSRGMTAAATSTGGFAMKLPGRVGDSAIIGAGTYAVPGAAVSVTGHGEPVMRHLVARRVAEAAEKAGARAAVDGIIAWARAEGLRFGVVVADVRGGLAWGRTTEAMCWAAASGARVETFLGRHRRD